MPKEYYLIKFAPTRTAHFQIVGCLRFPAGTTHEQREESLKRWQAKARPGTPLQPDEAMYLDKVNVVDAILK